MRKFDYDITTYEIRPPIGGVLKWGSKAVVFDSSLEGELRKLGAPIGTEHWGKTEDEARSKAVNAMRDWLSSTEPDRS